jgi:hypothetical protein
MATKKSLMMMMKMLLKLAIRKRKSARRIKRREINLSELEQNQRKLAFI